MSRRWAIGLVAVLALGLLGCEGKREVDRTFGRSYGDATNGLRAFKDLISGRDNEVRVVSNFNHKFLEKADVLVFVAPDPAPLDFDALYWFQEWLTTRSGRMLVYVGHDFNSDVQLYDDLVAYTEATGEEELAFHAETRRKLALYELEQGGAQAMEGGLLYPFAHDEELTPKAYRIPLEGPLGEALAERGEEARLFLRHHPEARRERLGGEPEPDDDFIDPMEDRAAFEALDRAAQQEAWAERQRRDERAMITAYVDEPVSKEAVLLASEGRVLVSRRTLPVGVGGESHALLVHNASFLLNYSLMDPAHRELAAGVLDELGTDRKVAFFDPGNRSDRSSWWFGQNPLSGPNPLEALLKPPMGWVFLHWLLAGLMLLLARSVFLGRPRSEPEDPAVPFASHVRAYARLLERSRDRDYADQLIDEFESETRPGR